METDWCCQELRKEDFFKQLKKKKNTFKMPKNNGSFFKTKNLLTFIIKLINPINSNFSDFLN